MSLDISLLKVYTEFFKEDFSKSNPLDKVYYYPYETIEFHDCSTRILIIKAPIGKILPEYFFSFFYYKKIISRCDINYLDEYLLEFFRKTKLNKVDASIFYKKIAENNPPEFIFSSLPKNNDIDIYQIYEPFSADVDNLEACWLIIAKDEIFLFFFEIFDFSFSY